MRKTVLKRTFAAVAAALVIALALLSWGRHAMVDDDARHDHAHEEQTQ